MERKIASYPVHCLNDGFGFAHSVPQVEGEESSQHEPVSIENVGERERLSRFPLGKLLVLL